MKYESLGVFGRLHNKTRSAIILDFMIENKQDSYTITEICKFTGISNKTVFETIKNFLVLDIVKITRRVAHMNLYRYNMESEVGKLLDKISLQIASIEIDLELKKQQNKSVSTVKDRTHKVN